MNLYQSLKHTFSLILYSFHVFKLLLFHKPRGSCNLSPPTPNFGVAWQLALKYYFLLLFQNLPIHFSQINLYSYSESNCIYLLEELIQFTLFFFWISWEETFHIALSHHLQSIWFFLLLVVKKPQYQIYCII